MRRKSKSPPVSASDVGRAYETAAVLLKAIWDAVYAAGNPEAPVPFVPLGTLIQHPHVAEFPALCKRIATFTPLRPTRIGNLEERNGLFAILALLAAIGELVATAARDHPPVSDSEFHPEFLSAVTGTLTAIGDFDLVFCLNGLHLEMFESMRQVDAAAAPRALKLPPDNELNIRARQFLASHPDAGCRPLAKYLGCSEGKARKLPAYLAVKERRGMERPPAPKAVSLSNEMAESIGDRDAELDRLMGEQKADNRNDRAPRKRHGKPIGRRRKP